MNQAVLVLRVERGPDEGRLLPVIDGGVIGRQGEMVITDPTVGREHARVAVGADGVRFVTMSPNATLEVAGGVATDVVVPWGGTVGLGAATAVRLLSIDEASGAGSAEGITVTATRGGRILQEVRGGDAFTIGRDAAACDVVVDDPTVSRRHARIRRDADGMWSVEDLRSSNGTFVGGRRLAAGGTAPLDGRLVLGQVDVALGELGAADHTSRDLSIVSRDGSDLAIRVEAGPLVTVADIAGAVAPIASVGRSAIVWRVSDGYVPSPGRRWASVGVRRGDRWMVEPDWTGGGHSIASLAERAARRPVLASALEYEVQVNRPPRPALPPSPSELSTPPLPNEQSWRSQGGLWQLVGTLFAALAMVGAAFIIGGGFIVFAMVALVASVVTAFAGIGAYRSRRVHRVRMFDDHLRRFDEQLASVNAQVVHAAQHTSPAIGDQLRWLQSRGERVWERRPFDRDWCTLRVGVGTIPTPVAVREIDRWQDQRYVDRLREVIARHSTVSDMTVVTPGSAGSVIAVRGEQQVAEQLGAALIVQACTLHDPRSLPMVVIGVDERWKWAEWLPHVLTESGSVTMSSSKEGAQQLVAVLRAGFAAMEQSGRHTERGAPTNLLVVLGPGALAIEGAGELCLAIRRSNAMALVVCGADGRLPPDPSCLVEVAGQHATVTVSTDRTPLTVVPETLAAADASRAARLLAPLVDAATVGIRAEEPSLLRRMLEGDLVALDDTWRGVGVRPAAIGDDDSGHELTVDLRVNGPHAVLSGTTGSGKSEFIKTLLISLALEHSPSVLNLFLIDFKGGSTFFDLASLPHVVGVVTDLEHDRSLAERTFASLDAEIVRRKALLQDARVIDIIEYERSGQGDPMPTLLVVIDEFALLKEQFPDLVPRLDTVAKQGRSLGVHLLLGTQDPRSVVSNDIRANTNLWVSLRVVLREQSMEILGTAEAAAIPAGESGRGFLRYGATEGTHGFRTYWVTRPKPQSGTSTVIVRDLHGRTLAGPQAGAGATLLNLLVEHVRTTAARLDVPAQRQLWQEPLPMRVDGAALDELVEPESLQWVVGMFDDPTQQLQGPLVADLHESAHVLAIGAYGTGKSTFIAAAVAGLASHLTPAELHVYGIDGANGDLGQALRGVPHVGGVIGVDDRERLGRLAGRLRREIERRRSSVDIRGPWAPGEGAPYIVLAIDEIGALRDIAERWHDSELADFVTLVLQGGPGVGVHVIASAVQLPDLRQPMLALFGGRLVLRMSDAADYRTLGVTELPVSTPPGRGWWIGGTPALTQVALRDAALARSQLTSGGPVAVAAMPTDVLTQDVVAATQPTSRLLLGLGGAEVEPVWFDPLAGRQHLLVLGEARTGRTSSLASLLWCARRVEPSRALYWIGAPPPWPVGEEPPTRIEIADAEDELVALRGPAVVGIDRSDSIVNPIVADVLHQLVKEVEQRNVWLFVAGRPVDVLRSYDDWLRRLASLQIALLLNPSPDTEIAFDLRPARVRPPTIPGRGLFVVSGRAIDVHTARLKGV